MGFNIVVYCKITNEVTSLARKDYYTGIFIGRQPISYVLITSTKHSAQYCSARVKFFIFRLKPN